MVLSKFYINSITLFCQLLPCQNVAFFSLSHTKITSPLVIWIAKTSKNKITVANRLVNHKHMFDSFFCEIFIESKDISKKIDIWKCQNAPLHCRILVLPAIHTPFLISRKCWALYRMNHETRIFLEFEDKAK